MNASPLHRASGRVLTRLYAAPFRPRHCAGTACFHNHGRPLAPVIVEDLPDWTDVPTDVARVNASSQRAAS